MKECPKCHTQYEDSMSFCTKDGCQLVNAPTTPCSASANEPIAKPRKKKGGCLKTTLISIVVLVIGFVALYKYIMNAASYLRVEPDQVVATKAGGECSIDIDYDGYVWFINHTPYWVEVTEYDDKFTIEVTPNKTGVVREGSITVQSGNNLAQVVIKQLGTATVIRSDKSSLHFSSIASPQIVAIETDGCGWEIESPEWVYVDSKKERTIINCDSNDGEYRTGYVTFKEDNVSTSILVVQGGKCNNCHGKGNTTCPMCHGFGGSGYGMYYSSCLWCGGNGSVHCQTCNGTGKRG